MIENGTSGNMRKRRGIFENPEWMKTDRGKGMHFTRSEIQYEIWKMSGNRRLV
jgi:hypothetical protein